MTSKQWSADDLPDMTRRTVIVTGGFEAVVITVGVRAQGNARAAWLLAFDIAELAILPCAAPTFEKQHTRAVASREWPLRDPRLGQIEIEFAHLHWPPPAGIVRTFSVAAGRSDRTMLRELRCLTLLVRFPGSGRLARPSAWP